MEYFILLFFSNPTHQTKIGTAYRWEITNNKLHKLIIMIDQSEIERNSYIIFITFFFDNR
jgi:hypothetical protein